MALVVGSDGQFNVVELAVEAFTGAVLPVLAWIDQRGICAAFAPALPFWGTQSGNSSGCVPVHHGWR